MDIKAYCDKMRSELNGWESRLSEELDKIDQMPSVEKYKMLDVIEDLNMMLTEMRKKIDSMRIEETNELLSLNEIEEDSFYHIGYVKLATDKSVGEENIGG